MKLPFGQSLRVLEKHLSVERAKRNALLFFYEKDVILLYGIGKLWYNNYNIWISETEKNRTERFLEMRGI